MTDFGNRLKQARKEKHMTQKEFAKLLGVEQSAISNYETNFRTPPTSALMEIAETLDVSVAYLLGGEETLEFSNNIETSNEVSSFDYKQLQSDFLSDLLEGQYHDAFERVIAYENKNINVVELYKFVFEPTLKAIGLLWEIGKVSIADEHIISDLINRALVSLGEKQKTIKRPTKPFTAAFMLPGSELHDFPLKISAEVFKQSGWTTFYIGKCIPVFSLQYFLLNKAIDVLVLSVTVKDHLNSCETLIHAIREMPLQKQPYIIVGGSALDDHKDTVRFLGADQVLLSMDDLEKSIKEIELMKIVNPQSV